MATADFHLAVALDGTGWHPTSWREPEARPRDLFAAGYWTDLVAEAERCLLDLVTIEDTLALQSDDPRQVTGRLDAVLVAARVAPLTRHVGIVPTQVVTHTEPFHASKAIATLDYVSTGRAGVRVRVSHRPDEAALFGRRTVAAGLLDDPGDGEAPAALAELFDEAADYVEVLRRLWDSWEDDAEIRDAATGRFVDREKLHYIDFHGAQFSVRGPSITPRPPQGQPVVAALAHRDVAFRLVGRSADLGFVTPRDAADAGDILGTIRAEQEAAGRGGETVHVFGDVVVFLDASAAAAAERKERLDALLGHEYRSDARVFVGTPAELADLALEWRAAGLSGLRLRPGVLPHDLEQITRGLVPELQRRGAFRTGYEADTLRGLLGLSRPANRYAA
ncbi:LLM class flavin-dependent oxidoreductase [Pseudonocardia charpentierae]|uniref:LLM class flavin-dependent oxidoreductase n=1 Tax=Pseudonocardia charpentierae TaxID=3075545 RepID=A0ABU2NBH9_9PSEU|nr:LLM class flavin-dependent oxidoreductase [Pseudonocardia sp. DSM 45834]MDT0350378.1 LLM class flavin-dependent oxidoreductase [Pseudonocardia sp. DSM 45834]